MNMPKEAKLDPLSSALLSLLSDACLPPETAAVCAELYAAKERYNTLALIAKGLYERMYGALRSPPVLHGDAKEFFLATSARTSSYGRQIIEMADRERSYDEVHAVASAYLHVLREAIAPYFPPEAFASEHEIWGDTLVCWPEEQSNSFELPASDRWYLTHVGLPARVGPNLRTEVPKLDNGFVILGHDYEVPIAADSSGRVWALEDASKRVVNGSVAAFGRCLAVYEWYGRNVRGLDDEEAALMVVRRAEGLLRAADANALRDDENYWAVIVEQMEYGHL